MRSGARMTSRPSPRRKPSTSASNETSCGPNGRRSVPCWRRDGGSSSGSGRTRSCGTGCECWSARCSRWPAGADRWRTSPPCSPAHRGSGPAIRPRRTASTSRRSATDRSAPDGRLGHPNRSGKVRVALSFGETVLLGALAGFTIYLGLPFGRIEFVSQRARVALAMFSVGALAFLFAEVFVHGLEIVEQRVDALHDGSGSLPAGLGLGLLFGAGFTAGLGGLAFVERRMRNAQAPPIAGGATDAMTVEQAEMLTDEVTARARALRTGMAIAAAIGLHNFAEGL